MSVKKTYDELKFTDDFLFWKILTSNLNLCKGMLELILGFKIKEVKLAEGQKAVDLTYDGHGVSYACAQLQAASCKLQGEDEWLRAIRI